MVVHGRSPLLMRSVLALVARGFLDNLAVSGSRAHATFGSKPEASRCRANARSPLAAFRKARGDRPAARWKVRTKFERSPNPTSQAISLIDPESSASNRTA